MQQDYLMEFIRDENVRLIGVEAVGNGIDTGKHSATLAKGQMGIYHGTMSYLLQDDEGQIIRPHSVGVGDENVRLIGVEAAGNGIDTGKHSATLAKGQVGIYHGTMSYLLQDDEGQIIRPHSVGLGLEYPGVSSKLSFLKDIGHAEFYTITDEEALEGIFRALEAAHALAYLEKLCPTLANGTKVVVNCSSRGDKDAVAVFKLWLRIMSEGMYAFNAKRVANNGGARRSRAFLFQGTLGVPFFTYCHDLNTPPLNDGSDVVIKNSSVGIKLPYYIKVGALFHCARKQRIPSAHIASTAF
ncbi:Tryptophan synthase [Abeliophyllum distichum]|uniref:Tryptophan synthase n=1 Tax=Abeliophyllum distichum TaxID=126358 RepID=A0ABD1PTA4_9LAMI